MHIAVIGLGLIGGSFCKAIKKYTDHQVLGLDNDHETLSLALAEGAIDRVISPEELSLADLTIACLHPSLTLSFLLEHADKFKKGSLVIDSCGVKTTLVHEVTPALAAHGVTFVGCHPMAGREFSGYRYAQYDLYKGASFIITPDATTPQESVDTVRRFAKKLQFDKVVVSTPEAHDRIIAFTSQLAHVVSSAYVKSPSLQERVGFSAGSFLDLTRVAQLNPAMWSDLFLQNRDPLVHEIDTIIGHLQDYRNAIQEGQTSLLYDLLQDGSDRKKASLEN